MGNCIRVALHGIVALLLAPGSIRADDPLRSIRQFQHTSWTAKDGAPADVWALDQGPDGFLWLGTGSGLFRFDGTVFDRYRPARGEQLASIDVTAVRVLPSNEIWIGYSDGGISQLKDGHVTTFTQRDGIWPGMIVHFRQDSAGALWAVSHGGLARFSDGRWSRIGADWNVPAEQIVGLFVARDGTLWLSTARSIYFSRPHSGRFEPTGLVTGHATVTQTPDGTVWFSDAIHGVRPMPGDAGGGPLHSPAPAPGTPGRVLSAATFAVDRLGVLWGTERTHGGIFRFDPSRRDRLALDRDSPEVDVFRHDDGLTADRSIPILSDREGNIWVGTIAGLDRFSRSEIVPDVGVPLPTSYGYSIAALPHATYISDGVWLYRALSGEPARRLSRLPEAANTILLRTHDGALWYGNDGFLHRRSDDSSSRFPLPEGERDGRIDALAEDGGGRLWAAFTQSGVYRFEGGAWSGRVDLGDLPTPAIAASDASGNVWFGYADGRVSRHDAAGMRVFSGSDGLAVGNVESIAALGDALWVGGELGIARLNGERFDSIGQQRVPPLIGVSGIGTTADGDLLFHGLMGIVRVDPEAMRKALAETSFPPEYELYDRRDGLPGVAQQGWHTPTVVSGADGRVWFVSNAGVSSLSPAGRERNLVPPSVSILSVTAQGIESFDTWAYARAKAQADAHPLALPPGTSSLAFAYTATALRSPESVRFRHKLEGLDLEWVDAGGHREAAYRNLGPGRYRFLVSAANEDGVWSEGGASLAVVIPPTFLQSTAFKWLVGLTSVVLLGFAYTRRMRIVADRIHGRMAERMEERERIARALHDTLLQSVQALTLKFQVAAEALPRELATRTTLEAAIDRADAVIAEGRDRIRDLRLLQDCAVEDVVAGIVERQGFDSAIDVAVTSAGARRALDPLVLDEVTRIASEALFNVWRHASATRVEIEIGHGASFRLRIADDGVGIDPEVLERGERSGHFGLPGMRESARMLRGTLEVRRLLPRGAELTLTIPASIAYKPRRPGTRADAGADARS